MYCLISMVLLIHCRYKVRLLITELFSDIHYCELLPEKCSLLPDVSEVLHCT